jgi:hypothetical protein
MTVARQYNFTRENAPTFLAFINTGRIDNSFYKDKIYFIERLAAMPEYRPLGIKKNDILLLPGGKGTRILVNDVNFINELKNCMKIIMVFNRMYRFGITGKNRIIG